MEQLLCHLIGDYFLQNSWMAAKKIGGLIPAIVHCLLYTSVFLFTTTDIAQLSLIFLTHLAIDYTGVVKNLSDKNLGDKTPDYLKVMLGIIRDNTTHLICNYLILEYI